MEGFGSGLFFGMFLSAIFMFVVGVIAIPQWEDRIVNAKETGCTALGAKFEGESGDSHYANGQCVKGDTIVLRFKDKD